MSFTNVVAEAKKIFPVQIKYKNEDAGMKILGKLMFFNPSFMTDYITTIGYTVYYPSRDWVNQNEISATISFIHECVHMNDEKRYNSFLWKLGYLFPHWLSLLVPFLLFVLSWKIVLPLALFFLLPLPAPFRMISEKRAYLAGIYAAHKLYNLDPSLLANDWSKIFKDSSYYWMWIFGLDREFEEFVNFINMNKELPIDSETLKIVNQLISAAR